MCYKTTRWIEVKWRRPICSCRYVVLAQTAQPAAASRTDTQYASMHAEVELQSELDWTSTLGGDMNRFSLLLLDLHPVDLLRHVPNKIRSANVSCSPALHVHTFVSVVFFFCFSRLPATDLCQRRFPGQCPALGLDCGAWAEHRPVLVQLRPTHDTLNNFQPHYLGVLVRLWENDFKDTVRCLKLVIVLAESLQGTFISHWCLDAKQDAVKPNSWKSKSKSSCVIWVCLSAWTLKVRFKSDFFWNHVNAVILFIIVVVESLRGTFFSHWCLDAKQDAVKTKLHSKSR